MRMLIVEDQIFEVTAVCLLIAHLIQCPSAVEAIALRREEREPVQTITGASVEPRPLLDDIRQSGRHRRIDGHVLVCGSSRRSRPRAIRERQTDRPARRVGGARDTSAGARSSARVGRVIQALGLVFTAKHSKEIVIDELDLRQR